MLRDPIHVPFVITTRVYLCRCEALLISVMSNFLFKCKYIYDWLLTKYLTAHSNIILFHISMCLPALYYMYLSALHVVRNAYLKKLLLTVIRMLVVQ